MAEKRNKSTFGSGLRGSGRLDAARQRVMAGPSAPAGTSGTVRKGVNVPEPGTSSSAKQDGKS